MSETQLIQKVGNQPFLIKTVKTKNPRKCSCEIYAVSECGNMPFETLKWEGKEYCSEIKYAVIPVKAALKLAEVTFEFLKGDVVVNEEVITYFHTLFSYTWEDLSALIINILKFPPRYNVK